MDILKIEIATMIIIIFTAFMVMVIDTLSEFMVSLNNRGLFWAADLVDMTVTDVIRWVDQVILNLSEEL